MIEIYLISIVVGFLLGYLTNWLAIVSLFHPRKKFLGFQGLVPRYKKEIGERIGENAHVIFPDSIKKVFQIPLIGDKIKDFFKDSVANEIVKMSDDELEKIIKKVAGRELRFIEVLGGVIGMVVGLLQAILISIVL